MERIKEEVSKRLVSFTRDRYGMELEPPVFLYPPSPDLGDLALATAFDLGKRLRKNPRALAAELSAALEGIPGLEKASVAGGGYVNLYLDRPAYIRLLLEETSILVPEAASGSKIIVEHTNINPNKAAHIGHLRNAALGDTLARCLRFLGRPVEVQNYIDDTGVQVADLAIGITHLERLDLEGVRRLAAELAAQGRPLDHYCWDLYARVTEMYEADEASRDLRGKALLEMEEGTSSLARIASFLAEKIVRCHLATMQRISVRYDLLPWESDILAHRFWDRAFDLLKRSGSVTLASEGKNAGCWVMDLSGSVDFADLNEGEKILVRSNGTVTYVGKDIAYQLWKFGLLGSDFDYRPFHTYPDGGVLWTTDHGEGEKDHPAFGSGSTIYNVIDVRQSYLQRIVAEGLRLLGYPDQARRSIHFSYEMVALSPRCAAEMGLSLGEEDRSRPYLEISGRKGVGIKADDLVNTLIRKAEEEVAGRNPELAPKERTAVAQLIAIGSLRYYMVRFTRNKVIAFDFADALSFDGETGPYVQYAAVRAGGILEKVSAAEKIRQSELPRWAASGDLSYLAREPGGEEWELASLLGRLRGTVEQAVSTLELSGLAKYAFVLAQKFNAFYHKYPVLRESDPHLKRGRALLTHLFRERMTRTLDLMGIPVPPFM
ncbi:MAG TPA: arginine--tRNA ligase [Candidatus Polarisedimenticolia bacterium]|nr:arginine--tRNA ligase [Candidatus Polarisedimenticolia bacterium]